MSMVKATMRRVALVMALLALAVGLVGCGGGNKDEEEIRALVDSTFAVFADPAHNDMSSYMDEGTVDELSTYGVDLNQFYAAVFKHLSYTVNEVSVDGDTAQAALTVSNVNLDEAMAAALEDFDAWTDTDEAVEVYKESGEDGLYRKLFELLYADIDELSGSAVSTDVTMYLQKGEDGTWDAADEGNEALYSSLYGGATFDF